MGVFNMFIVIPMLIQNVSMPLYYNSWLNGNPENAIRQAGIMLILGAISVVFIKNRSFRKNYSNLAESEISNSETSQWNTSYLLDK